MLNLYVIITRWAIFRFPSALTLSLGIFLCIPFLCCASANAQISSIDVSYEYSIQVAGAEDVTDDVLSRHVVALGAGDLVSVADIWQRRVQSNLSQIAVGVSLLETVPDDEVSDLVEAVRAVNRRNVADFQNYLIVVNALARKGGPEEELKKHEGFIRGFIGELLLNFRWIETGHFIWDWVLAGRGGLRAIRSVVQAILTLFLAIVLGGVVRRIVGSWLKKREDVNEITKTLAPGCAWWAIVLLGVIVGLWGLGVSIGLTTAVLGGLGFLLAFALQNFFQSAIGGILLQATNPYAKGDVIMIDQTIGTVVELDVISTKLKTLDNRLVQIPNQAIWQGAMENLTKYRVRRVDLVFSIGYHDSITDAKRVLENMLEENERCLRSPRAMVVVGELAPSSVDIFCRPWVRTEDYWEVLWGCLEDGKARLQDAGISIAYPQMDVHLHSQPTQNQVE